MQQTRRLPAADDVPGAAERWLVLLAALPTEDPATRMVILRSLAALGVAVLREGAYLLPDRGDAQRALGHVAEYIARNDGSAHLLRVRADDAAQQREFCALFDRSARYEALIETVSSLELGFGISEPGALARVLHKQRRAFEAIAALDFFPGDATQRARRALDEAETRVRALVYVDPGTPAAGLSGPLRGRTWASRRPLWADRLATAWLIRRFVDPEAILLWLERAEACPPQALGFAFDGAPFANSEGRVTFEALAARVGLGSDAALARIGGIVHFLELKGVAPPEAAGVQVLLQGVLRRASSSDDALREAEQTFDLLYEAYSQDAGA